MAVAGYAYFSRVETENHPYEPPGTQTWDADVRVYAVNDDGSVDFLGAGTYTAAHIDYLGMAYGYAPPNESNPDLAYHDIDPSSLKFVAPALDTFRLYHVESVSGDDLLASENYDLVLLPPGTVESGKTYITVSEWSDDPFNVALVLGVTEITTALWGGITVAADWQRVAILIDAFGVVVVPSFWTGFLGTKEVP